VVSPVALISIIMLASRQKALPVEELLSQVDLLRNILRKWCYGLDVKIMDDSAADVLKYAEQLMSLSRFQHPNGDVVQLKDPQTSYAIYYRNNIAHLYALPSLMAFFLQYNDSISENFLLNGCELVYPILKKEMFLPWSEKEVRPILKELLATFLELNLFQRNANGDLARPNVTSLEFSCLRILGYISGSAIEQYAVAVSLLKQYKVGLEFSTEEFQERCVLMAQRIALLTGSIEYDLVEKHLFKQVLQYLTTNGYLETTGGGHRLTSKFDEAAVVSQALLSSDIRHNLARDP
jgi:glycerol-3-phosphate O-acyltransferase